MDNNYKIKTLGVSWKPNSDHFGFYSNLTIQGNVTKRQLLSETAKLFDPVGWLSPIVIRFKVLLQKLWVQGIEWDQHVSKEIQNEWEQIKDDLPNLAELKLQRCISPQAKIANVQLHLFTDDSEMAYAAVIYARITDIDRTGILSRNSSQARHGLHPSKQSLCLDWNFVLPILESSYLSKSRKSLHSQIYQAQLPMDGLIPR